MSKADDVRRAAMSLVGEDYSLGNEPWYDVGWEPSGDPLATDCSGMIYGVFRKVGVKLAGKVMTAGDRLTAHGLYRRAAPISQPSEVGDLGFLLRNGRAYHVFMYVGRNDVVEAGDGTGHVGLRTVAHENARGATWGRLDTDIGQLTEEDEMTEEDVRRIVREEIEVVNSPAEVDAAQKYLVEQDIIAKARTDGHAAGISYVDLVLSRVMKKLSG